jgi:RNA recognition motif-containing protein
MKIYVGNLNYNVTEDDLRASFEPFGDVSEASVISDRFSGRSKGFGFVEMPNQEEAEKAIAEMNGKEIQGRSLIVNQARPREERPRREGGGGGERFRSGSRRNY